jgi:hypothetical protein
MLSFSEMRGFYYECFVRYCLSSYHSWSNPLLLFYCGDGSLSVDLIFMIMLWSNIHYNSLPSTFIITNLQIYTATLHTSDRKGFLTASKIIKENIFIVKSYLCFLFIACSMVWPSPPPPPPPANYKNCSDILIINVWDPTTNLQFVCIV